MHKAPSFSVEMLRDKVFGAFASEDGRQESAGDSEAPVVESVDDPDKNHETSHGEVRKEWLEASEFGG